MRYTEKMFSIDGKIAVITGAGMGIGAAIAKAYADAGAYVMLCGRNETNLVSMRNEILRIGGKAEVIKLDVTDMDSLANLYNFLDERFGHLDILVNSAGYAVTCKALDVTEEDFDRMCDVGFKGLFFCCQKLYPLLKNAHNGKIINLSSTFSKTTGVGRSVYSGIKAGVSHLTEALSVEWATDGILVNALAPTAVLTPSRKTVLDDRKIQELSNRIPLGRIAETDDLIGTALFLASSASDFITGQTIYVDGGWTAV